MRTIRQLYFYFDDLRHQTKQKKVVIFYTSTSLRLNIKYLGVTQHSFQEIFTKMNLCMYLYRYIQQLVIDAIDWGVMSSNLEQCSWPDYRNVTPGWFFPITDFQFVWFLVETVANKLINNPNLLTLFHYFEYVHNNNI